MKPLFRWRTEEDADQDEENLPETAVSPHQSRRLIILAAGLLLAGAALVYWRQISQIQREEARIQADVLASHQTWLQAVTQADYDLFAFLLSPQDPAWQNAQRALFLQGLALDRAPLALYRQGEPENTAVSLAPDWQAAELTFEQTYTAVTDAETTAIIRLQQTIYYQLNGSRWLQTSPPADFWGETLAFNGQWLTLFYPARDAAWAERLAADLDAELAAICRAAAGGCSSGASVRLATAPGSLADLHDLLTPALNGRFHILPTFTLTGLPLDEVGYQALYHGYTRRIITAFQNSLDLPFPLPAQAIQSLCFPGGGNTPHLFRYDPAAETWTAELSDRAFRFLSPLPEDDGLILVALPASDAPSRLQLSLWQAGQERPLFNDAGRQWRFPPIGWSGQQLMLHEFDTVTQTRTLYGRLHLNQCGETDCAVTQLPGFTIWAPDGRFTLLAAGSELSLGDESGQPLRPLGAGFTPFWLDETTFGYTRYNPELELVVAAVADETPRVLLDAAALTAVLDDPDTGFPAINYVAVHPTIPGLLFLAGSEIRGASGKYNIFTFDARDDGLGALRLRLQLDDPPLGYPTLLTPAGVPPITFSENGRWLVVAQLAAPPEDAWHIQLYDIIADQTQSVTTSSPRYPANSPFFDWSKDGQWLVVVDDGFFKLIAPAANYERLILHDFDACYFTAWVNR